MTQLQLILCQTIILLFKHDFVFLQAFFRRALVQKRAAQCKRRNQCDVSGEKSAKCAACRLAKCREIGMCKEGRQQISKHLGIIRR